MKPWTEARVKAFIISCLRNGSRRWPPKFEALKEAQTGVAINKKTNRKAMHFRCASCLGKFPRNDVEIDHIVPIRNREGFKDWNSFIELLFCRKEGLQILCKVCHKNKTNQEKEDRLNESN